MKNNQQNNRGSEWRKWDLHIHTPFTKLNDQYKAKNKEEKWNLFCQKIEESDVSVFGITDYFSIENYLIFLEKFKKKYPNSKKVFFSNVEFRINERNSKGEYINIHVIFSSENEEKMRNKIQNFFIRLKIISTDDKKLTGKYCTKNDLEEIGYRKAMIPRSELENKLRNDFEENEYLLGGVVNGYGSFRLGGPKNIKGRGDEAAKELDKNCKFFFGKQNNTNFYLNKIGDREKYFLPPKPILTGSDAHSFETLDKKLGKWSEEKNIKGEITDYSEITWIKANPTFEGLKQIVYEPENRIKIQESKPEEKNNYQIISKVRFCDDAFSPKEILINQNLTTIIGGKSTGKSILLRNIAESIDSKQVEKRIKEANLSEYKKTISNFFVTWKDSQEDEKEKNNATNKKIIYIPQSFLNRLVEKEESKTSIDEFIEDVLEQETDIKDTFSKLRISNRETEKNLTQNIDNLFYKEEDIELLSKDIKKIGDKKGIEAEVKKLETNISELNKKTGMTEKEISKYESLSKEINISKNTQETIKKDLELLSNLKSETNFDVFSATNEVLKNLSPERQEILQKEFQLILEKAKSDWKEKIENEYKKLQKEKNEKENELKNLNKKIKPFLENIQKSKLLNEKIKKLEKENKKLKEITKQEKNLEKLNENFEKFKKNITKNHAKFFENFSKGKVDILKQQSITKDRDLKFSVCIRLREKSFQENGINDFCNQTKLNKITKPSLKNYKYISPEAFNSDLEEIIKMILTKKISLKITRSRKEAITKLVQNWFAFNYKIEQKGDDISEMSPGKKSLVFLKLLIALDNSKCPILLDQPEDDLDNRTIYNDLVTFIKTKKKERQIIIVTHNPNLVVGADSECIIVANQDVTSDKSEKKKYRFEYVQGALENTFIKEKRKNILCKQGIKEHICDILEGGKVAFQKRKEKYNF